MVFANPSLEEETPTGSEAEQTPDENPPAQVSEEAVKNHPLFKKLEEEHSAAEREKNRYKGRLDKVQKGMAEEEEKPAKKKDESPYATKEELWELRNAKDVELYGDDEYKTDLESGIPRDYALKTAKLRYGSNQDKARLDRQKMMASGSSASVRNLESEDLEGFNEEDAKRYGYTKETWLKHQKMKQERRK